MSDYKTCPLELAGMFARGGTLTLSTTNDPKLIPGVCGESTCAWYDSAKECCAVLAIAKMSRQK